MNKPNNAKKEWSEERAQKAERIYDILSSNSISKDGVILDIGCYEGKMEQYFSKKTNNLIIGIDISFKALKIAVYNLKKENISNVEFIVAHAENLPIQNEKIRWIICNHVIDYIEAKKKVITECTRILQKSGIIYLAVINSSFLKLYRMLPFLFRFYLGPFYGRTYPSYDSEYGTPQNYDYWKNKITHNENLHVIDLTPEIMFKNKVCKDNSFFRKIKNIISRFSPSWIFILQLVK